MPIYDKKDSEREKFIEKEKHLRIITILAVIVGVVATVILVLDLVLWQSIFATIIAIVSHVINSALLIYTLVKNKVEMEDKNK